MGEINGAMLRASGPAARLPIARNFTLDARAGMLLHRTAQMSGTTDLVGSSYTYDASGRLVQDFEGAYGPGVPTKPPTNPPQLTPTWCVAIQSANQCYANGTRTKTYDAENRLHGETFTYTTQIVQSSSRASKYGSYWEDSSGYGQPANIQSVDYGTTNHPMRFSLYHPDLAGAPNVTAAETRVWLWDGDARFIKCEFVNGQCQNPSLSVGGLGDYDLAHATIVVVNDRNRYGLASMTRDIGAFSGWIDMPSGFGLRTLYVPCSTGNADADPLDPTPTCPPQHDGHLTADGWSLDYETWQGVRTSDLNIGQWNTPDAYVGEVRDPMSQKPYMWNRNNPYEYSDPSGYDSQRVDQAIEDVMLGGVGPGMQRGLVEKALLSNIRTAQALAARLTGNVRNGRALEQTSGTGGPKTAIQYPNGGRGVPDRLTRTTIEEAKAGRYQSNTSQLRGQQDYASENGLSHILHTYEDIKLSGPLQQLIDQGKIIQKTYPRPPMQIK
ncbi:MAG TPA: putative toxin [Candidatus Elarobacter sp.]|nr:putative toxin [Candidatus Elarobacter sp.]